MSVPKDPLVGVTIAGRYLIERRLGMGGMGAVYLAAQESLGRSIALKVLRGELVGDPVAVERFKNEAKVIAQLGHPHVVGIHDFGTTDDGTLFIAMEFLPGRTLAETVRAEGPLPWRRTLPIVRDIARALSAAHRRGVVHRDLKPENVLLVDAEGLKDFVKVLDFGIAKLVRGHAFETGGAHGNLTGTGLVPGTPGYIAPEQITGGSDDPRSDLYALGVTWFEMLTARRPFEAESVMKIFLAQLEREAPLVSAVHPGVKLPPPVEALLSSLLAREPEARPASAEALLARLKEIPELEGVLGAPHVDTPVAGSLSVEPVDALHPDAPTMPALTTPSVPVPAPAATTTTPSTGTTQTGRLVTPEDARATRIKWTLRWAAASVVMVALAVVAFFGWTNPRMLSFLDADRMPLPVASPDDNVRIELTNAIEAFYEGELDVANRGVDKVLRASADEPGALVLKIALAGRMADKNALGEARAHLQRLLHDGLPASCLGDAELVRAVIAAAKETADGVGREWDECSTCHDTGLGHLLFSGFFADRFSYDGQRGLEVAAGARRLLPRAALPVADHARFLLRRGGEEHVKEALTVVDEGLAINAQSPLLHQVKAEALLALGRYEEAERELREALSMSTTPDATALLAQVLLLRGDEDGRRDVVEAALRRSTVEAHASLAMHHAAVLVGAGRVGEALAMYRRAIEACVKAGTPSSLSAASILALDALRAADAAHVRGGLATLKDATAELLQHINLPREQADVTRWVLHLVEGALAADRGDLDVARRRLEQLTAASSERLPPQAHQGIVAYLTYRVYLAAGEKLDEAERAATHLGHPCTVAEAKARLAAARGDAAHARRGWEQLVANEGTCRLYTFGGAHSLNARAELVILDAKAGKIEEAKKGLDALLATYPRADPDLEALRSARAALGEPAPAAASSAAGSPESPAGP